MKDVLILSVTYNIPNEIQKRFSKCIELSKPKCSYDIQFISSSKRMKSNVFNKSILLNDALKEFIKNKNYKVLIQADIDLIVPSEIIDKSLEIASQERTCFYNYHRRIDQKDLPDLPDDYLKMNLDKYLKDFAPESASGCWNAMSRESWLTSGGYNEYMEFWGKEDDYFRKTARIIGNINFINYNRFCLIHVNHDSRQKDNRKYNKLMEYKLEREGLKNWLI